MHILAVQYSPRILKSLTEICDTMGVGERMVKRWVSSGAPIAVEGEGNRLRYSAEALRLQMWREAQQFTETD